MIIAVDFDGTLCVDKYPEIGEPNQALIDRLISMQKKGDRIILWTCRDGGELNAALAWCSRKGLEFDAVNDNLPETIERFGGNNRKIHAHLYIDDKGIKPDIFVVNQRVAELVERRKETRNV